MITVEDSYEKTGGEFLVVENEQGCLVGSAAFYPVGHRGEDVVEIRKMYLEKGCRGVGLGRFLLECLEGRVWRRGFKVVLMETVGVLEEACALYESCGYVRGWPKRYGRGDTERCDRLYSKILVEEKSKEVVK